MRVSWHWLKRSDVVAAMRWPFHCVGKYSAQNDNDWIAELKRGGGVHYVHRLDQLEMKRSMLIRFTPND
jgi:hypothetical protein